MNADIAALSVVPATMYGTTHTYFTLGSTYFTPVAQQSLGTLMMIYE
jgi:hypothetical protein